MPADFVQIHHADYLEDIPFWLTLTEGKAPVLEIGCGHGRVTIPLLKSGRRVTGIEVDTKPLSYLAGELEKMSEQIQARASLIQIDILDYLPEIRFGSVIIPCNTYSTFLPAQRARLLKNIRAWLKSGGLFVASLPNPTRLRLLHKQLTGSGETGEEVEDSFIHPGTGNPIQVSSRYRIFEDRLGWDWIYDHLLPDGNVDREVRSAVHDLASVGGYREELFLAGFDPIACFGDFDQSEYSTDSPYLILVCSA